MRLIFRLRFHTQYGQSLFLTGNHEIFGGGAIEKALPLHYLDDQFWEVAVVLPADAMPRAEIIYNYAVRNPDGSVIYDWGADKVINLATISQAEVLIIDSWNDAGFYENAFYTEPFKRVLLKGQHTAFQIHPPPSPTHTFKVKAPLLTRGQTVCVLGNTSELKNWNTAEPILLGRESGKDFFEVELDLARASFPVAYKYGVYDLEKKAFVRFEDGENRVLSDSIAAHKRTIINDGFVMLPATTWKGAGVAIPVFSLRSENSFGVGEFSDLKLLTDWCKQTGLKLIQILPINDTIATHTWTDSYPYAAISAFALHPLYINLGAVATGPNKRLLGGLEEERKRLNELDAVDYEAVVKAKLVFLRRIYPSQKEKTLKSKDYRRFFEQNKNWLAPYAVFCHLRDSYGTPDFNQWPAHRSYQVKEMDVFASEGSAVHDEIAFHYFVQYHLHLQLKEAADYAHAHGVILKGDIAIGVYRHGADAWQQPELFHLEFQAGAPPDPFGIKGQNWGFPTYNWPRMKASGFAWWKQRFEQMSSYFDAFRIDHILGFFRIWSIPVHAVEGILGFFVPALPVLGDEFRNRGIPFEPDRYTKPYITDEILREAFGDDREEVKSRFLDVVGSGRYVLKPEFATQRQVEAYFCTLENNPRHHKLKHGLYDLISNVILLRDHEGQEAQFHFRFNMQDTASFRSLDANAQRQLKELYNDYFFRRQDGLWRSEATEKLPALKRVTNMLVCGEDLGMVPACVPEVMKQLGLLSLEIQRMPKDPEHDFSNPKDAPYLSVVTPSTHDMSTIRGWWEEDPVIAGKLFNQELGLPGEAPAHCEPWINKAIVLQHLSSPAMWSVFQLQDLLGMDETLRRPNPAEERINVPANPRNYWRYRMHLPLEKLNRAKAFNGEVKESIKRIARLE